MPEKSVKSVRAIDRAIDVLQSFTIVKTSLTVNEISLITKIPKSTVYRVLCTLEQRNLVQFNEKNLTYQLGLRLLGLGFLASSVIEVRKKAEEYLVELHKKTNQTVLMAVKHGHEIIYVFNKENSKGLKYASVTGQRRPFIYGVLGPSLLAFLPKQEIEKILSMPVNLHIPFTNSNKEDMRKRLKDIRDKGICVETSVGVTGIGAPVFKNNEAVAAIGVIGPSIRLEEELEEVKSLVAKTSSIISGKLDEV